VEAPLLGALKGYEWKAVGTGISLWATWRGLVYQELGDMLVRDSGDGACLSVKGTWRDDSLAGNPEV
jgi:hypothetical protein